MFTSTATGTVEEPPRLNVASTPPSMTPQSMTRPSMPAPREQPGVILTGLVVGAAVVLALWWHNTPSITGLGDWLTNAGRVTGLLAGYGVVVLVALMARIRPLDQRIGSDRLTRWHASGGRYTVTLVVAHGLLIL